MMPSSRKPPLARSPIHLRLRPRRPLQSNTNTIQTPPGSSTKSQLPKGACEIEESELGVRPEYRTISCELRALAKMVHQEFSSADWADAGLVGTSLSVNRSTLFERGRFYEEYSARRNERLKRKKVGETGDGKKTGYGYDLGVRVESAKRRGEPKRFESLRKTVPSTPTTDRSQPSNSRYLLRSATSKENKKPPMAFANVERSVGVGQKKIGVRRGRKN